MGLDVQRKILGGQPYHLAALVGRSRNPAPVSSRLAALRTPHQDLSGLGPRPVASTDHLHVPVLGTEEANSCKHHERETCQWNNKVMHCMHTPPK